MTTTTECLTCGEEDFPQEDVVQDPEQVAVLGADKAYTFCTLNCLDIFAERSASTW